jgi:hypothetical protein
MSDQSWHGGRVSIMKKRVTLEPQLEERAALWTPAKRVHMARIFERWARQLRVSARIISVDSEPPPHPPAIPRLPRRKLALN